MHKFRTALLPFIFSLLFLNCEAPKAKRAQKTKRGTEIQQLIQSPATNDFYTLIAKSGMKYKVKVDTFSTDTIDLLYLTNDEGNLKHAALFGELLIGRKPTSVASISKLELMDSENALSATKGFFGKIILPSINNNQPLEVFEAHRIKNPEKEIYVNDPQVKTDVKEVLSKFLNATSTESNLSLLDSASINYLHTVLEIAASVDLEKINQFIDNSEFPAVEYHVLLFTKYLFLKPSLGKPWPPAKELLQDYAVFHQLFCPGLWSNNQTLKELNVENVSLRGMNLAKAYMRAKSNILTEDLFMGNTRAINSNIPFGVIFHFENEKWKVNLPSSYDYIHQQIRMISRDPNKVKNKDSGTRGEENYREMIRQRLMARDTGLVIDPLLFY